MCDVLLPPGFDQIAMKYILYHNLIFYNKLIFLNLIKYFIKQFNIL
jgi:hypothetical protein